MSIQVTCPHCQKAIKAPDRLAGTKGRCPACQAEITIVEERLPQAAAPDSFFDEAVAPAMPAKPSTSEVARESVETLEASRDMLAELKRMSDLLAEIARWVKTWGVIGLILLALWVTGVAIIVYRLAKLGAPSSPY